MGEQAAPLGRSADLSREIGSTRRRIEERAGLLRDRATSKELLRPVMDRLKGTLGEGGEKLLDAFRDNPIPFTLAGIGIGWLLLRDRPASLRRGPPSSAPASEEPAGGVGQHVRETARSGTQKTIEWFEQTLDHNPLVLTVGALAAGVVAGLAIPVWDPDKTPAAASNVSTGPQQDIHGGSSGAEKEEAGTADESSTPSRSSSSMG